MPEKARAAESEPSSFFVVAAPGLEPLVAKELSNLGVAVKESLIHPAESGVPADESGGAAFTGSLKDLYRANLHLRTASRVLVRLGDFYAAGFPELRKKAGRLGWERFLWPGQPVDLHVTCHKSKLYHSGAVAERVLAAIGDRLGKPSAQAKPSTGAEEAQGAGAQRAGAQIIVVRLVHDHCTISVDSSGELLHRRGYRLATAKAPLRETLAAAMLLIAEWDRKSPLVDPFCGSGTIPIEAAMLALGIPPGRNRKFAFMNWPGYAPEKWEALLAASQPHPPAGDLSIQASDRDAGAIKLAQANAARAGVAETIEFTCRAVSAIQPPARTGWVITNPPYGIRVSANQDLRNLYAQFGNVLREHCPGWQVAVLCTDLKLLGQIRIRLDTSFSLINGGVRVRLARGRVE